MNKDCTSFNSLASILVCGVVNSLLLRSQSQHLTEGNLFMPMFNKRRNALFGNMHKIHILAYD